MSLNVNTTSVNTSHQAAAVQGIPCYQFPQKDRGSAIDYSVPGNRLIQHADGSIELPQKTPAELFGEQILRPMIDLSVATCRFGFNALSYGFSSINRVLTQAFNFIPGAEARSLREDRFVVVHDNKDPGQPRLGVVNQQGKYWDVTIRDCNKKSTIESICVSESEMEDLESITKVQGLRNTLIACRSGNFVTKKIKLAPTCFYLQISENENKYEAVFVFKFQLPVPTKKALNLQMGKELTSLFLEKVEIEGFALGPPMKGGKFRAIWAHRGPEINKNKGQTNGLTWMMEGIFDLKTRSVVAETVKRLQPPFLTKKGIQPFIILRPITDLFIADDNQVFAVATWDADNDDPSFQSRVYKMDTLFNAFFDSKKFWSESCHVRDKKGEGLCQDSNNRWVIVLDNEKSGGEICTSNVSDCKHFECFPLQVEKKKASKNLYAMSGIALLDQ